MGHCTACFQSLRDTTSKTGNLPVLHCYRKHSTFYNMAFGISFIACLTPRSARISSVPPRIASNL